MPRTSHSSLASKVVETAATAPRFQMASLKKDSMDRKVTEEVLIIIYINTLIIL